MLMADHWVVTFDCCVRVVSRRSRCVIRAYITAVTYSMGVFRVQIKKERGEGKEKREREGGEGGARGDKGELSWENGGARGSTPSWRRENRLSLFSFPCILEDCLFLFFFC